MAAPLIASIAAACAYGVGSVLQSAGAKRSGGQPGAKGLVGIARDRAYLAGLTCDFAGWLLMIYAVRHLPLFAVQTVLAGSLVVTAGLGWAVLGCRLRPHAIATMCVSVVGLVLVGTSAGIDSPADRHGLVKWLLLIWCPAAVVGGLLIARSAGAVTTGCVAGVLFSLGVTTVRTIEDVHSVGELLANPLTWVVLAYSGTALAVHARALEVGKVGPVTAAMWSTEIVVGSTLGFILLGDQVRHGAGWQAIVGLVLAVGSTVVLANSAQHDETPVSSEAATV